MKKIKKLKGHVSNKYGRTLTEQEKTINRLIDEVRTLNKEFIAFKNDVIAQLNDNSDNSSNPLDNINSI